MGLVRFVTTTGAGYSGITSKDKDTLYFISDERRIYKGEVPYSGGIFTTVAEFPETGEVNTLYVNSATGEVRYYNGTSYQTVVPATGKSIAGNGDGSLATTAAVAAYVTSQIGDLNISALKGRVDTLEGEMDTAQGQITTINGEGDGSIKKAVSDAIASAKSYTDTVAAGKANTAHTHKMADVTDLSDALAGKANATHTHAIADVTGLQTALNGKANKATTLAGYGIGDAYTKNETDTAITIATAKALESRIVHAEAETLEPDSEATASLVPEGGAQCLRLGIPKGATGPQGVKGDTGPQGPKGDKGDFSPTAAQLAAIDSGIDSKYTKPYIAWLSDKFPNRTQGQFTICRSGNICIAAAFDICVSTTIAKLTVIPGVIPEGFRPITYCPGINGLIVRTDGGIRTGNVDLTASSWWRDTVVYITKDRFPDDTYIWNY